jgi:hypothetical protein
VSEKKDRRSWSPEKKAEIVLAGLRGYRSVQGRLVGSVSRGVLVECKRPVVAVRDARVKATV